MPPANSEGFLLRYNHNKALVPNAKDLRKNMTKEERRLWYDYLRKQEVRFVRQKIRDKKQSEDLLRIFIAQRQN